MIGEHMIGKSTRLSNSLAICVAGTVLLCAFAPADAQETKPADTANQGSVPAGLKPWEMRPSGVGKMPLAGGLSATDMTTFRMRYPANFVVDRTPHYHFGTEHVIVLKGTVYLGYGSCLDPSKAVAYGPGSFLMTTAGQPHFEWFEGEVELQVTSIGPMNSVLVPNGCPGKTPAK
jgi:hypothetical protein